MKETGKSQSNNTKKYIKLKTLKIQLSNMFNILLRTSHEYLLLCKHATKSLLKYKNNPTEVPEKKNKNRNNEE